jgi:Tol biopolymer transport system component
MNTKRDADTILGAWLEDGPLALPDDTRRAIAVGLRTTPQRRRRLGRLAGSRRGSIWPNTLRIAIAAAISALALIAVTAFTAWQGQLPSLLPAASPDPSPTASPIAGPAPTGTPSAGAIAYVTMRRIALVDPVTGDRRDLVADDMVEGIPSAMAWSPDGRALAFIVSHSGGCDTYAVSSDGTTLLPLLEEGIDCVTHLSGRRPRILDWSPDGSQVAVGDGRNVNVAALDGSAPVDLGSPCDGCQLDNLAEAGWSPDGSMFAARFFKADDPADYRTVIAVVDVATGTWTAVWKVEGTAADGYLEAWLPDGSLLIQAGDGFFAVDPRNPQQRTPLDIEVTPDPWFQVSSPDQSRVVYVTDDGVIVRELSSGETVQVADWVAYGRPVWSPDSSHIAVVRRGGMGVWVVGADGSNARELRRYASDSLLAWQPVWP